MYFEQKIVNGILCYRHGSDAEWMPYSAEDLTGMLENYHKYRHEFFRILDLAANYDYLKSKAQNLMVILYGLPY